MLGISIVLALALPTIPANAYSVENVGVSETGGDSAFSGQITVTGSSDASAEIRNIIRSNGENTRVRVDVRTKTDEDLQTTIVEDVSLPSETVEVEVATSLPWSSTGLFERFERIFSALFKHVFSFWR